MGGSHDELIIPSGRTVAATPHASDTFAPTRGFYVGVTGDITVQFAGDSTTRLLKNCMQGVVYPFSIIAIKVSGTDATNIVLLY